jgi:hypothetical protein
VGNHQTLTAAGQNPLSPIPEESFHPGDESLPFVIISFAIRGVLDDNKSGPSSNSSIKDFNLLLIYMNRALFKMKALPAR